MPLARGRALASTRLHVRGGNVPRKGPGSHWIGVVSGSDRWGTILRYERLTLAMISIWLYRFAFFLAVALTAIVLSSTAANTRVLASSPDPIGGVAADTTFCELVTEMSPVYFEAGAADLTADAQRRLDENLEVLRRCPEITLEIHAYTDDFPDRVGGAGLSQARADAVRAYYEHGGLTPERIRDARGRGEDATTGVKRTRAEVRAGDPRARRADTIPSSVASSGQ
ncbi:MAG: hypothetical protein Rubg2KO_28570 [Rubricoccaceae bacterium]